MVCDCGINTCLGWSFAGMPFDVANESDHKNSKSGFAWLSNRWACVWNEVALANVIWIMLLLSNRPSIE